jgi:hypothetical protein
MKMRGDGWIRELRDAMLERLARKHMTAEPSISKRELPSPLTEPKSPQISHSLMPSTKRR